MTVAFRDPAALVRQGLIAPGAVDAARRVAARYAIAVTPEVAGLIDPCDPDVIALAVRAAGGSVPQRSSPGATGAPGALHRWLAGRLANGANCAVAAVALSRLDLANAAHGRSRTDAAIAAVLERLSIAVEGHAIIARAGGEPDTWPPRQRLLLRVTDALHADRDLPDDLWVDLRGELDERQCIELLMLVGHYDMLATTLLTLRVQPDH